MRSACSSMEKLERSEELTAGGDSYLSAVDVSTKYRMIDWASSCVLSGCSPRALTLDFMEGRGYTADTPPLPFDVLNITVPGAPACWCDTVQLFGSGKVWLLCVYSYVKNSMYTLHHIDTNHPQPQTFLGVCVLDSLCPGQTFF